MIIAKLNIKTDLQACIWIHCIDHLLSDRLKQREEALKENKEDTQALVKQVKDEYDAKVAKLTEMYESKLKERNNVIKQLLKGGDANEPQNDLIAKINARRTAQNKKW